MAEEKHTSIETPDTMIRIAAADFEEDMRESNTSEKEEKNDYKKRIIAIIAASIIAIAALTFGGIKAYPKYQLYRTTKAAEAGDAAAQAKLGDVYYDGKIVPQDYVQAAKWYEKSADQFNADGLFGLGRAYLNATGKDSDISKALDLFKKAVSLENTKAMVYMGMIYCKGTDSVRQDYAEAEKLFRAASEKGDSNGTAFLGLIYLKGWGVPSDNDKAFSFFKKAAEAGNPRGERLLGAMYYNYRKDYKTAYKLYKKAAAHNSDDKPFALANLGQLYLNGDGVDKDYSKAVDYYIQAYFALKNVFMIGEKQNTFREYLFNIISIYSKIRDSDKKKF